MKLLNIILNIDKNFFANYIIFKSLLTENTCSGYRFHMASFDDGKKFDEFIGYNSYIYKKDNNILNLKVIKITEEHDL